MCCVIRKYTDLSHKFYVEYFINNGNIEGIYKKYYKCCDNRNIEDIYKEYFSIGRNCDYDDDDCEKQLIEECNYIEGKKEGKKEVILWLSLASMKLSCYKLMSPTLLSLIK